MSTSPAARSSPASSSGFAAASRVLLLGVVFHALYLWSIFDIYFTSPVIQVARRYNPVDNLREQPPADRVVLIVGDGLRADKLFQLYPDPPFVPAHQLPPSLPYSSPIDLPANTTTPAPYLRSLITEGKAAWGVSHTRVPTESRPGHVALLAGMYEDVSAVTRGWKINPVGFDSILNQSTHAWGFGSPDIVPMFVQGATPGKAEMWCYSGADEDFTADATALDTWVLERVEEMFRNATSSSTLDRQLRQRGNVFFLHLLGLDTTGHSYRPHSPEYHRNIVVVDAIVKRVEQVFADFFKDERTSFVFTADHGMTNIGNHGDGNPDSTRTPLIVWGSGAQPAARGELGDHDEYSAEWGLHSSERTDVKQADVAALMSALVGLSYPANSEGRLPLRYLQASEKYRAHTALSNAQGILEQFNVKHDDLQNKKIAFKPFDELAGKPAPGQLDRSSASRVGQCESLITEGAYEAALAASQELGRAALRGLRYVRTYDRFSLRLFVVAGYLGWMAYAASFVVRRYVLPSRTTRSTLFASSTAGAVFAGIAAKLAVESSPPTYYLYVAFPCFFWSRVLADPAPLRAIVRGIASSSSRLVSSLVALGVLELSVLGYFKRSAWTLLFLILGIIWPFAAVTPSFRADKQSSRIALAWALSCVLTSAFTLLPVEKGESLLAISVGALLFIMAGTTAAVLAKKPEEKIPPWRQPNPKQLAAKKVDEQEMKAFARTLVAEVCLCTVSLAVSVTSALSLQAKKGLPFRSQVMGWTVLIAASLTPFIGLRYISKPIHRLIILIGGFAPVFVILSISYEVLFYFCFSFTLLFWLVFERRLAEHRRGAASAKVAKAAQQTIRVDSATKLNAGHVRIALCFLHFIHVGFFGTGNIASISSFYLEPVYRLVPVFDPFLMASLLIYKILIPFAVVSAVFSSVHAALGVPAFSIFLVALALTDVLTLNFFFLVRDEGSWLEIGQSISHFSIASLLIVFMLVLHLGGERLMRTRSGGWCTVFCTPRTAQLSIRRQ